MLRAAHVNLEMEVRTRGLGVAGVADVSDYLTSSYACAIMHFRRVGELRIAKIVPGSRIVVVQMVIKVLIAIVASEQDRIALSVLRSCGRDPVDRPIHDCENRRPLRTEHVLSVMRAAARPRIAEAARESNGVRGERKDDRRAC